MQPSNVVCNVRFCMYMYAYVYVFDCETVCSCNSNSKVIVTVRGRPEALRVCSARKLSSQFNST